MAETIDADNASWDEIKATSILTGLLAVVLTAVFEIGRRNPAVSAVFDRRRDSHAHRTPPPLLRNTILEWLFLSNTDGYNEYAILSHMRDGIKERWRQKRNLKKLKENPDAESLTLNANSQYQVRQRAAKLTHYLTPDAVEFNGRRLPAEIAEYAMAGDLTESQLDDYEQNLLNIEKEEEVEFNKLREEMISKTGGSGKGGDAEQMINKIIGNGERDDIEAHQDDSSISTRSNESSFDGNGNDKLILPPRKSRLYFFGFQHGKLKEGKTHNPHITKSSTPETQETSTSKFFSNTNTFDQSSPTQSLIQNTDHSVEIVDLDVRENYHVNRHLKSTSVSETRPLTSSDQEMLRCIGLDYFVMIRFLRFCFDVTFYPFLISCITLIPTYYTNPYDGVNNINENLVINEQTDGYFRFTVNRLEPYSDKLWVTWVFGLLFYSFVLRRLWIEWETFIVLRFEFLANGDANYEDLAAGSRPNNFEKRRRTIPKKDDVRLHLEQFRNSCIVEYIPESHRRDQELFQFFDSVFPGQVKRAEMMINTPNLSDLISRRQAVIELYEQFYAKNNHDKQTYSQKMTHLGQKENHMVFDRCCRCNTPRKPVDPTMDSLSDSTSLLLRYCCCYKSLCGEKKEKALPHCLRVLKKLNLEVENEYQKILDEKNGVEDRATPMYQGILDAKVAGAKTFLTGVGEELQGSTGFVEFTTLTAKQSALQCNLTGTTRYMVTTSAPDPRDVIWENVTVEHKTICIKKIQFDGLLFIGTLFWSVVVSAITSISDIDLISQYLPAQLVPEVDTFWYDIIQGYLPVAVLELLMILVTWILGFIARRFIRFKTNSEVDGFVFKWHLAYRVTNLVIIIVNRQLLKTVNLLRTNPQAAMDSLVTGIAFSSQFFLNNMIVATGTELLLELSQIPKMFYHFVLHKYITVEAASKRVLDELKVPETLEWGETIPPFIFGLLVAMVYSTLVPLVTGVCAFYFYLAAKVYTHQSLFVYAQLYEGGGLIMYQLNRSIFVIIYISIVIFSVLFSLKMERFSGLAFGIIMITITVLVDIKITKDFVKPSISLALTNARVIDEENLHYQDMSRKYQEYKAAKREKKREEERQEANHNLAKSVVSLNEKFEHDIDEHNEHVRFHGKSEDVRKSYIPALRVAPKYKNNSSAPSSSRRVKFGSPKRKISSQVSGRSGGKPSPLTLDSNKSSADRFNNDEDFYLYRQPQLNKALWETTPRPYWY